MSNPPTRLPDRAELLQRAALVGVFLILYEALNTALMTNLRNYLIQDGDQIQYERELAKYSVKSERHRAALWHRDFGAIDDEDLATITETVGHRNSLVHELAGFLISDEDRIDAALLLRVRALVLKINRWWIRNVDLAVNMDLLTEDIADDDIWPGPTLVSDFLLQTMFPRAGG